jgi:hypothetical protein
MRKRKPPRQQIDNGSDIVRASVLFDVQLLDLLAEVEALLRKGREAQREALRVRGEPDHATGPQRSAAAAKLAKLADSMRDDHRALGGILRGLRTRAAELNRFLEKRAGGR